MSGTSPHKEDNQNPWTGAAERLERLATSCEERHMRLTNLKERAIMAQEEIEAVRAQRVNPLVVSELKVRLAMSEFAYAQTLSRKAKEIASIQDLESDIETNTNFLQSIEEKVMDVMSSMGHSASLLSGHVQNLKDSHTSGRERMAMHVEDKRGWAMCLADIDSDTRCQSFELELLSRKVQSAQLQRSESERLLERLEEEHSRLSAQLAIQE